MLEVRSVVAGYGRMEVLFDVDLDIQPNEIVALVGSNGAGKTTLLRTISGLVAPTGGTIRLDGKDIVGWRPEQLVAAGVSLVPTGRRLFAGLTVRDNLLMGAYLRRDDEVEHDLALVLEMFPALGDRLGQLAGHLSGGEQQMCGIGRGLMSRPRLLMIDELSLGLAPNLVDLFLERLWDIAAAGTAILLVEQDVDAALQVASRAYVLESGRVVIQGATHELLNDPRIQEAYLGVA